MKRSRFLVQIVRRRLTPVQYEVKAAIVCPPEGGLLVVSLDGDSSWASSARADLDRLGGTMEPHEILAYLYDRNSTVTAYSRPTTLVSQSPEHAARELAAREENAA